MAEKKQKKKSSKTVKTVVKKDESSKQVEKKVSEPVEVKESNPSEKKEYTLQNLENVCKEYIEKYEDKFTQHKNKGAEKDYFNELGRELKRFCKVINTIRILCKKTLRQKRKRKTKPNTQSGFLKPVKLSKEVYKFTRWDKKELKSRNDLTKFVCNYIKENKLQNPEDRRKIVPDKNLSKFLGYKSGDLTYCNMQTYLKKHFV